MTIKITLNDVFYMPNLRVNLLSSLTTGMESAFVRQRARPGPNCMGPDPPTGARATPPPIPNWDRTGTDLPAATPPFQ